MTDWIPQYSGTNEPTAAVPRSVATAVRLMWIGAGISLLIFVVGLIRVLGSRDDLENAARQGAIDAGYPQAQVDSVVSLAIPIAVGTFVVLGLAGAGLWAWMAVKNRQGRNWARVLSTVFFALLSISIIFQLSQAAADMVGTLINVATWVVGLAAVIFMWRPESGPHYAKPGQAAT